jgi:hypothetical protein
MAGDETRWSCRDAGAGDRLAARRYVPHRPGLGAAGHAEGPEGTGQCFNVGEARIVGPSGAEGKGQDLWVGEWVRVELTRDGTWVQQVTALPEKPGGRSRSIR